MGNWSIWQGSATALGLLWLLGLSLRVRRLSRRVAPPEFTTRPAQQCSRQPVSVAELLAREDTTNQPDLAVSELSAPSRLDAETTRPVARPRQQIVLALPARAPDNDPGFWFRPASPPTTA